MTNAAGTGDDVFELTSRRRWLAGFAVALILLVIAAAASVAWFNRYLSIELRNRAIGLLEERLQSQVELADLRITWRPKLTLVGSGLTIRHHRRTDVPPLVSIETFAAAVTWDGFFAQPRRVAALEIEGLQIVTPPDDDPDDVRDHEGGGCRDRSTEVASEAPRLEPSPFVIEHLVSRGATLTLMPSKPGKRPRVFEIGEVTLADFALDRPAAFEATLVNPLPRGAIGTKGTFGPWNPGSPGATPVSGEYVFTKAELGTIKGIAGILESTGNFAGRLQQIIVKGETRVPDFGLTTSSNRLPLTTRYEACVDGTDGDTYLDRVDAKLQDTPILAVGRVEGTVGVDGRTIALDVTLDDGRIEDLLRLSVDDKSPLLTGRIDVKTGFLLPPGEREVVERLQLNGNFALRDTQFAEGGVQSKINELSRRGRGDMEAPEARAVRSSLEGRFALANGSLELSTFSFAVPGAVVQLQGDYGLVSERINFRGQVRTDARVSQMTTGFKSVLLKAVDPLFARAGAGAIFPIIITGTRESPSMKVDVKKALLRRDGN